MAKSISLSSDMTKLFFTDSSGFTTAFSLSGDGVYITSIAGDVQVIAAPSSFGTGTDEFSIATKAQWQIAFHQNKVQAVMIGGDDLDATLTAQIKSYDLTKGKVINLRLNSAQNKLLVRT